MTDEEKDERLRRALGLLQEWREVHGPKEHYRFRNTAGQLAICMTDLLRDTIRLLEGK